jgi:hypothetical protein
VRACFGASCESGKAYYEHPVFDHRGLRRRRAAA